MPGLLAEPILRRLGCSSDATCACRGFAFVEFFTKQEAKSAAAAVAGVHLYGRRLVVEFAQADEGLDELRAKAASKLRQ